jgi:glycosyltransferase involved in cell wall biosynthesis
MKIFILSYIYDVVVKDDMGGYRKVFELAENLDKLGHEIVLFLPKINYQCLPVKAVLIPTMNIPIIRPLIFNLLLLFYLLYYTLQKQPEIIYSRPINSFTPLLVAKLTSTYFVVEVNGDSGHNLRLINAQPIKIAIIEFIERINFKFSDKIIPITQGLKELIQKNYEVKANKLAVIESGSNLDLFKPMDIEYCQNLLNLDHEYNYVGFLGTFFKYQGIDTLIDSAQEIILKAHKIKFLMVGDGVMSSEWIKKTKRLGLSNYFIYTGQAPYKMVPYYINAMTICVAPFTANRGEASPLKLFDYFACGRPVISSDIPSIHQVLINSKAVRMVPPDNPVALSAAIIDLLNDKDKQRILGNNGRKFVISKYSWEAKVKLLMKNLEDDIEILKGKASA